MENKLEEYGVKCVKVLIANEIFWVKATSEEEAIAGVKDMLSRGLENAMEHRIEPVVEPTWFNYTSYKNGFITEESDADRN